MYNVLINQSATKPDFIFQDLAESFEHPDEVTYVFNIRPGVKIAPNTLGVPERDLDSEDALVSWQRIQTEPRANAAAFVNQFIDSFAAPDPSTFIIKTNEPFAWFLSSVGAFTSTTVPRELIQGDPSVMRTNGVGAGPFVLTRFTEGQGLSLNRNPNYYRAPQPYIDGIDVKIIPDRAARRAAFLSRQIHLYIAENKAEAEDILEQGDFYRVKEPAFIFNSFVINIERDPWQNPLVRRAVSRAINRQQFIDLIAVGDAKPNGLVHWPTGPFALSEEDLNTKYQPYNPEEATQLLAQAGYPDGLKIKVTYPAGNIGSMDKYVPILLEQFKAVGIEIEQDPQDFLTWLDNYRRRDYDATLALNPVLQTPQTPLNWHTSQGPTGDGSYQVGLMDPEVDEAVRRAHTTTTSLEELIEAVHDAQKLIYSKDPAYLPIYSSYTNFLYWNFVKNHPHTRGLGFTYLLINDWWLDL